MTAAGVAPADMATGLQKARLDRAELAMLGLLAGDTAYSVGATEVAVTIWSRHLNPRLRVSRARLLVQKPDFDASLRLTDGLQTYVPTSQAERAETAALAARLADDCEQDGLFATAESYWRWAILQSLQRASYYARFGGVLEAQGRLAEAAQAYELAVQTQSDQLGYHLQLARAWIKLGNDKSALESVRRALELDPNDQAARSLLRRLE